MKDKHGKEIKVGDILRYQETANDAEDYGKSIDEVVAVDGQLYGVQRIGFPRWTTLENVEPISLRHYAPYMSDEMKCAEIVGNVTETPERMTVEYAHQIFIANVEGGYVDIHDCDMDSYHAETVSDTLTEALAAVRQQPCLQEPCKCNYNCKQA
jgi:hypothetical protein